LFLPIEFLSKAFIVFFFVYNSSREEGIFLFLSFSAGKNHTTVLFSVVVMLLLLLLFATKTFV